MCLSGGDLLLRAVSVRIFAKLNSRVRLPSFLFECDTVRASLCQIQAQYVYRERLQTSVSTLQCPMTQNDCTAALPPVFCFVSFCFFKCDRWHLNHFVCLVVILRPYLHMPILHCLWWKYLQCVTDTQNSFFLQTERLQVDHTSLPLHSWGKVLQTLTCFVSIDWDLLLGGGVNACDDFICSDCTFWWSIEI